MDPSSAPAYESEMETISETTLLACQEDGTILHVSGSPSKGELSLKPGGRLVDKLDPSTASRWTTLWNKARLDRNDFEMELRSGPMEDSVWLLIHVTVPPTEESDPWFVALLPADGLIRRLNEVAAHNQAVLDTAVDAIITISEDGRVERANAAAERMFEWPLKELIGQNVNCLMPEPFSSEHDSYVRNYIATGIAAIIGVGRRVTGLRRSGQQFPVHLAVSEYQVDGRRHFTGILRDLSELERVQKQLLQSERLAAIGQMVTGLAHESRNALQRAQAHLDMLSLDLQEQPEQLDLAERTKKAIADLFRLYEEVRSYAAPIRLEVRSCRLSSIWEKEWTDLQTTHSVGHVSLITENSCGDSCCEVDVHRMEQVFRNILENAVHACEGRGTITVRCHPTSLEGRDAIRLEFEDTGNGMTEEVARTLFEPFFTTKQKGTGLGMAIVHRIIDSHAGTITAVPAKKSGAVVRITLPKRVLNRNAIRSTDSAES